MDDVRAVMDAVGFERAAIFAPSDAGSMAILFAATYPERTTALVLYGTFAAGVKEPGYPWGGTPAAVGRGSGALARAVGPCRLLRSSASLRARSATSATRNGSGRLERLAASPGAAAMLARMNGDIDVRHVLPSINVPTLVLHRRGELVVPVDEGRFIAEHIPGAKFVELDGVDHWPWLADADVGHRGDPGVPDRERASRPSPTGCSRRVLFTDIVARRARSRGWRPSLARRLEDHHAVVRSELSRFRGREIDTSGDGFFAIFDGPARAIRCACAIVEGVRPLGLDVRAGLHTGECELIGDKVERHRGAHVRARCCERRARRSPRLANGEGPRRRLRNRVRRPRSPAPEGNPGRVAALRGQAVSSRVAFVLRQTSNPRPPA